jgi:hypothetical protein
VCYGSGGWCWSGVWVDWGAVGQYWVKGSATGSERSCTVTRKKQHTQRVSQNRAVNHSAETHIHIHMCGGSRKTRRQIIRENR